MFLNPFRRRDNPFTLVVGMTGIKMGDRFIQVGCADAARLCAIAGKVGLSGRAAAVVPDAPTGARIEKSASRAGVLVEVAVSPMARLPVEDDAFDLVLVDDTALAFSQATDADRAAAVQEATRVLRQGGRLMVLGNVPQGGLAGALSGSSAVRSTDPSPVLLANGYRTVRVLAERDGLIFYEGMKPRV